MKKKILIGVAVIAVLAIAYVAYLFVTNRSLSPATTAVYSKGDIAVKVNYCQPSKKGRLIFGPESDGALQPFGKYWRLGANDATQITFNKNVLFGGKPVSAGTYRMYAVPGKDTFEISLNSELGKSGASTPDYTHDVVKINAPVTEVPLTEQFIITFEEKPTHVEMNFVWDKTEVIVPLIIQ